MYKRSLFKVLTVVLMLAVAFTFVGCSQQSSSTSEDTKTQVDQPAADNAQPAEEAKPAEDEQPAEDAQPAAQTEIDKIKAAGKIVLGTSADYPPYEFHKEINGDDTIVGFDVEIAKEVAKDLGVELEIKDMKFDGLLTALDAGKIDFVIAGMTPTEERKKNVDFSNIYYEAKQGVVVRAEDKDAVKTVDDLKGQKIGAQKGSIQQEIAQSQIPDANILALGKVPDLVLSLQNKKVKAIVMELPVASLYVDKNKDLAITSVELKDEEGGSAVAMKKGSAALVEAVNKTLDRLKADGTIDKFVKDANAMNLEE